MESGGAISTAVMAAGDKRVRVVLEVTEFFKNLSAFRPAEVCVLVE
jgi:hypothetical protein